ncbi:hypothetical protein NF556_00130 [Ornithinimicrobium faecis]|uniref:Uncharacterized protein n=1 Tax=Ornithinimicrobium faecis TaxID=2934158 RepID=A0ABY4YTK7_9MICO|nr:hypothetical protein [Ornithinimicrobium sp. HY1793]USQ80109.1 hypothetical protein NF556_00130 [Ornithinimicrobium sp. HY1793]
MATPVRAVLFIGGSVATGVTGLGAVVVGGVQVRRAHTQMQAQATRYEQRHDSHLAIVDDTSRLLQILGGSQERALHEVIFRMRNFLESHAKQVKADEHLILDGVGAPNTYLPALRRLDPDVTGWVRDVIDSALVGAATPSVLKSTVSRLGTASTGTSIASLRGAAATNATCAWFADGSIAAGGGGKEFGDIVLRTTMVGPALLVAGIAMKRRGTAALTAAEENRTAVEVLIAELNLSDALHRGVQARAREVNDILVRLISGATEALNLLESEEFAMDLHATRLQRALVHVKAVRDIATAPIVDDDGNLNVGTEELVVKYRTNPEGETDGSERDVGEQEGS